MIYQFEASRDYDPEPLLSTITAPLLAINSADDQINPPELGIVEREITKVEYGRFVLLPITAETRGHATHSLPVAGASISQNFSPGSRPQRATGNCRSLILVVVAPATANGPLVQHDRRSIHGTGSSICQVIADRTSSARACSRMKRDDFMQQRSIGPRPLSRCGCTSSFSSSAKFAVWA